MPYFSHYSKFSYKIGTQNSSTETIGRVVETELRYMQFIGDACTFRLNHYQS